MMESPDSYLKTELFQLTADNREIFEFIEGSSLDGMWFWDLENPEEEWMSPKFWTTLGYDPEDMPHKSDAWQDIIFPEDLEVATNNALLHFQDPSYPYDQVVRYRHKDGSTVWIRCRGLAIRNEHGQPVRMLGAHVNMTREYRRQRQMEQDLHNYHALIDNQGVYIVKVKPDGTYSFANGFYCRDLGLEKEDLTGKDATLDIIESDLPKYRTLYKKCFEQPEQPFRETITRELADGSHKTAEWEFKALSDEDGKIYTLLGVGQDITEQLKSERELQGSQEMFRFIAENTSDGLFLFEYGKVSYVSPSYLRILGYTAEEEYARTYQDIFKLLHPGDRTRIRELISEMARQGETIFTYRYRALHSQGHYIWREDRANVTYDASGKAVRAVIVARDISEKVRQEEELKKKNQALQKSIESLEASETQLKANQEELNTVLNKYKAIDAALNSSTIVSLADKRGKIVRVNQKFCEISGYEEQELLGQNHNILNSAYHPKAFWTGMWKTVGSGKVWQAEVCNRAKDGSLYWVDTVINPVVDKKGKIYQYLSVRTLITQRKQAEKQLNGTLEQLEEKNLELKEVMAASNIGTWEYDVDTKELQWDEHLAYMIEGDKAGQSRRAFFKSLIHPDDRPYIKEFLESFLKDDDPFDVEYRLTLPSGNERIFTSKGIKQVDEQGELLRVVGTTQDITEKKLVEREINYMQKILEQAGDIARIGGWVVDLNKNTTTWSPTTREIHEVPEDYIPYPEKGISFYKEGPSRETITRVFTKCMEDGTSFDEELELVTYTGREIWVRAIGTAEFVRGKCTRLFGTFQDITPQITAKQDVEREQQFSRQMLNNMVEGFSVIDGQNVQMQVNKAFCKMTGFSETELVGQQPPYSYWPEEEIENIQKAFSTTQENGNGVFELVFKRKDGSRFPVSVAAGSLKDHEGKVTNYFANITDIGERKKAEYELRRTKDILNRTSKVARVGGWEFDVKTKKVDWTDSVKEIHEVPYDFEPTFDKALGFYTPESLERLHKVIEQAINEGISYNLELQIVTAKNHKLWIRAIGSAEFVEGECVRLFGTLQDIDQQKKAHEALAQAKENAETASVAKSDFLANMSHEIRTPLNSVIGFTDLLIKTDLNESQHKYMGYVHHSANSLLDLINDILDFSKIEAGKLELAPIKTDIWELSQQIVDIIRYKTNEKGLELILDVSPQVPQYTYLDPVRIKQILVNLVSNAVKFTKEGFVRLEIALSETHDDGSSELLFGVEDTGIGIDKSQQQKIFEAFSQEDASTTRKFGGTGLGLSISNSLLHLMDSQLELESEVGKGSRFFFIVRMKTEPGNALNTVENLDILKEIQHVLVVDDNSQNGQILEQMLGLHDIPCTVVSNAYQALEFATTTSVDVLISDYQMPIINGLELIQKLRSEARFSPDNLDIILLHSIANDEELIQKCREQQVQQVINKPITAIQLFRMLASLKTSEKEMPVPEQPEESSVSLPQSDEHLILIVDDNAVNRVLARTMVTNVLPNAAIEEAVDGSDAISKFLELAPSLVLMDVQMPEISGYEAAKAIRKVEQGVRTPIIALTAGTVKGEKERCLQAGMDAYLSKPMTQDQLAGMLSEWLPAQAPIRKKSQAERSETLKVFNRDLLLSRFGDEQESIAEELLEAVRKGNLFDQIEEISDLATAGQDEKKTRSLAHSVRGVSNNLCFEILADLAKSLENMEPFDFEKARHLAAKLLEEGREVQKTINA